MTTAPWQRSSVASGWRAATASVGRLKVGMPTVTRPSGAGWTEPSGCCRALDEAERGYLHELLHAAYDRLAEMARRRVTMVELSKRTGVPRSTLAYQVNSDCLTAHNLLAVAKALGVDKKDLPQALPDHPLGRIVGDHIYITEHLGMTADGGISYYARAYNQTRIALLEPDDYRRVLTETIEKARADIPAPAFTLASTTHTRCSS